MDPSHVASSERASRCQLIGHEGQVPACVAAKSRSHAAPRGANRQRTVLLPDRRVHGRVQLRGRVRVYGSGHAHDGDADDDSHDRRDDGPGEGLAQPKVLHQAHERDDEQLSYLRGRGTAETVFPRHRQFKGLC